MKRCHEIIVVVMLVLAGYALAGEYSINKRFISYVVELPPFSNPASYTPDAAFADFLFEQELFDEAALEYQRTAHIMPMANSYDYSVFQQAKCHIKLGEYDLAAGILDRLGYKALDNEVSYRARLLGAIVETARGKPRTGEFLLSDLVRDFPDYATEIYFWRGWQRLIQYEIESAKEDFDYVCNESIRNPYYFSRAYGVKRWLDINGDKIHQRSPYFARWLSGLLPGTGQIYSGKSAQGINSFAINGVFGFLTISEILAKNYLQAGVIFLGAWNRYYFGGMINSTAMAKKFNQSQWDEAIAALIETYIGENTNNEIIYMAEESESAPHYLNGMAVCADWTLVLYKNFITTQDAQKCQFNPGCSDYSRMAFQYRNPLSALLITSDRLQRCNPFAQKYYPVDSTGYLEDPLEK